MRFLYSLILLCSLGNMLFAQQSLDLVLSEAGTKLIPSVKTIYFRLGDQQVPLKIQQYGERTDLVFINLHDDETTSVDATRDLLEETGGLLIELENKQKRNIRFRLGPGSYTIDPNRIFSNTGIKKSLDENGRIHLKAVSEIEKLAERILQLFPQEPVCIIALHNNTPENFGATSYSPGNSRSREALKVFLHPGQDPDDFYLTTDAQLYEKLANQKYNTILQDNIRCTDDGSLSVYCGKRNIRYVNLETEHGKTEQYYHMMKALIEALPGK